MAFTFVEIEERKTRTLVLLFGILCVLYVASVYLLVWLIQFRLGSAAPLGWQHLPPVGALSMLLAAGHWWLSSSSLVERVVRAVGARALDSDDTYHQRLRRIVEEVQVATGGRYAITPYVIPTTAMNACAVTDARGRAVIAVTEGLLARLSRPQLEAVIGHEAAHIARGDSLATSTLCGLFGMHEEMLRGLWARVSNGASRRGLGGGRNAPVILLAMLGLWFIVMGKRLCAMAISRNQEYRADAVAVRLTRNPLALAEALSLISRRWRGIGSAGESLSTIFFVDSGGDALAAQEGVWAGLFSTHPPAAHRIAALVSMAHVAPEQFEREMDERLAHPAARQALPSDEHDPQLPQQWQVWQEGAWAAPMSLAQLEQMTALSPETWIRCAKDAGAKPAHQEPAILALLRRRHGAEDQPDASAWTCPNCHLPLARTTYEGTPLSRCPDCRGCYVRSDQVQRIFAREVYALPEEIRRLAAMIPDVRGTVRAALRRDTLKIAWLAGRQCPACSSGMARKFYSPAYLVEVEQCPTCGLTWLDRGELELLQYLYEEGQRSA
jgi:heat shock protein HtpX